jgi:hypothetical protein
MHVIVGCWRTLPVLPARHAVAAPLALPPFAHVSATVTQRQAVRVTAQQRQRRASHPALFAGFYRACALQTADLPVSSGEPVIICRTRPHRNVETGPKRVLNFTATCYRLSTNWQYWVRHRNVRSQRCTKGHKLTFCRRTILA